MSVGKHFEVRAEPYGVDIVCLLGLTDDENASKLKRYKMPDAAIKNVCNDANGRCVLFANGILVIRTTHLPAHPFDKGTLAHEVLHAVDLILHRAGVRRGRAATNEAYCYLNGYITQKIYEKL